MTRDVMLRTPEATDALGAAFAATLPTRAVVYLQGPLGAGKSQLARALLRALGVQGTIRSPTYTLVERHAYTRGGRRGEAAHLDLYRIADPGELDFLGIDTLADEATLWLVEWPERGGRALPNPDLRVQLEVAGEGRLAHLEASSAAGEDWLSVLHESGALDRLVTPV